MIRTALLAVLLLPLAGCPAPAEPGVLPGETPASSGPAVPVPDRVDEAREQWAAAGPAAYQLTLHRSCFCPPEYRGPFMVTVRDGDVETVRYEGQTVDAARGMSVESLFDLIEDAYARGAERVDAEFDPTWGYPTRLYIDYEAQMADEEIGYEVLAVEPLAD